MSRITEIFKTMEYGPAPEAASPAQAWLAEHQRQFGHFINGTFTPHVAERAFDAVNPANANIIAKLTQANSDEVNAAVEAATKAAWTDRHATEVRFQQKARSEHQVLMSNTGSSPKAS